MRNNGKDYMPSQFVKKCYDYHLKSLVPMHRIYSNCDMYILEDAHYLVMQCPYLNEERNNLLMRYIK